MAAFLALAAGFAFGRVAFLAALNVAALFAAFFAAFFTATAGSFYLGYRDGLAAGNDSSIIQAEFAHAQAARGGLRQLMSDHNLFVNNRFGA